MAKQTKHAAVKKVILEGSLLGAGEPSYESGNALSASTRALEPGSIWGNVEDAFFERGVEEEREAMALYAKLPARPPLLSLYP